MTDLIHTPFTAKSTAFDVLHGVDLTARRYVVTGGGSGIGLETVRALAGAGADVIVGARDVARAESALAGLGDGGRVEARYLDLGNLAAVRSFADQWEGPIHGFVANAGIMALPERQLSPAGWELQLATNYLGHFALLIGIQEHLFAAGNARVVTVSSTAHLRSPFHFEDPHFDRRSYDRWAAYAQSKTADVLLAAGVAGKWGQRGVTGNSLMPGWITTRLQRHLDDATLRAMRALDDDGNRIEQDYFKSPAQGAATSTLLVASPLLEGVTGRYFEDNQESATLDDGTGHDQGVARYALDSDNAAHLWDVGLAALR
jgi:NAD(P)-dependent dehydrogenase (short-subunit alcohol dehydrogenase family)